MTIKHKTSSQQRNVVVYFKEKGELIRYKCNMYVSHTEACVMIEELGHVPDSAVLVLV